MKTVVVIDATCDLPDAYVQQHHLQVLPSTLILDGQSYPDTRNTDLILTFFRQHAASPNLKVAIEPCPAETIAKLLLDRWVIQYDRAILISLSQTLSHTFQNATEASFTILRGYREKRRLAGLLTPFHLSVLDSKTAFAGEAVLVDAAIRLLRDPDLTFNELRRQIEDLRRYVHCYILPGDLSHSRNWVNGNDEIRMAFPESRLDVLLGGKSVFRFFDDTIQRVFKGRSFDTALSNLLDHVRKTIELGLRNPLVVISYAGDLQALRLKPCFIELERHARRWGVEVLTSVMSATGSARLGPGALSLAYAAD